MMFRVLGFLALCSLLFSSGCIRVANEYDGLAPGPWRGILKLDPDEAAFDRMIKEYPFYTKFDFEEKTSGDLPFIMEVRYVDKDSFVIDIINGKERIEVDDIHFGRDLSTAKDTIVLNFPNWQTHIEAIVEENIMEGHWIVDYKENYRIPFVAYFGKDYRFTTLQKPPVTDISGNWDVVFNPIDSTRSRGAVGEFAQVGNDLTGTFRTKTGDYRYLEGTIQANKFYLSTFDGTHAYLFEGKVFDDGSISGIFRSGSHSITPWEAKRAETSIEANDNWITYENMPISDADLRKEYETPEQSMVSLSDEAYKNKAVIIQVLGTWCPNCLDETRFLRDYIKDFEGDDLEVIGLAFERYEDRSRSLDVVKGYTHRLEVPYTIALGGTSTSKAKAAVDIPFLESLEAYPTMLLIDKDKNLRYSHTGFSGPATSVYVDFKEEFEQKIKEITQ